MECAEHTRLAGLVEDKRQAYAYIRLNQAKVRMSNERYQELVDEGYGSLTASIKEWRWHQINCPVCKVNAAG